MTKRRGCIIALLMVKNIELDRCKSHLIRTKYQYIHTKLVWSSHRNLGKENAWKLRMMA